VHLGYIIFGLIIIFLCQNFKMRLFIKLSGILSPILKIKKNCNLFFCPFKRGDRKKTKNLHNLKKPPGTREPAPGG